MSIPTEEENKLIVAIENSKKIDAGLDATRESIIKKARFYKTPIVVWRDGKMVELDPFSLVIEEDKNNKN